MKWSNKFPNKTGFFWFYGEPLCGSMGSHYEIPMKDVIIKMHLVEIFKISNGFMAATDGYIIPTEKFNQKKTREGYLGYFAKAELPEVPKDKLHLFKI